MATTVLMYDSETWNTDTKIKTKLDFQNKVPKRHTHSSLQEPTELEAKDV